MRDVRPMIEIDQELCDGCGLCVPSCHEGAIRVVDGKARLVADSLCDGLGACLGHCPRGALKVALRAADPFVAPPSPPPEGRPHYGTGLPGDPAETTLPANAQLSHPITPDLRPAHEAIRSGEPGGCPGSRMRLLKPAPTGADAAEPAAASRSCLSHWPVQIRLVPPGAPFLQDAHLVVAADCVPVALPDFHRDFVAGHAVMIGCPKFDDLEAYAQRFAAIFAQGHVRRVTVVVMEVPCCRSLPTAVLRGIEASGTDVPAEVVVVGVDGEIRQRASASRATVRGPAA